MSRYFKIFQDQGTIFDPMPIQRRRAPFDMKDSNRADTPPIQDISRYFKIFHRHFKILQDISRYFKILQDTSQIFQEGFEPKPEPYPNS